ncbi:MAG: hypothetical protein EXQ63_04600 [Ilumatobacteraceae bacterium]|nr:hypothetical protein [Ilumatobacteraceae bacterium]
MKLRFSLFALLLCLFIVGARSVRAADVVQPGAISVISAGDAHTCLVTDNKALCTGLNSQGQFGDNTVVESGTFRPSALGSVASISARANKTCAIRTDATLWCIGDTTTLTQVPLVGVIKVAVGRNHSCALLVTLTVWCWGANTMGQFGDGTRIHSVVPVKALTAYIADIAVGDNHTCAVSLNNSLWCWGANGNGQLGVKKNTPRLLPTQVTDVKARQVSAGAAFTCALRPNRKVQCWGRNRHAQLGVVAGRATSVPQYVNISSVALLSSGDEFTCAVKNDSTAWCWGRDQSGQLGDNDYIARYIPVQVLVPDDLGTISALATGATHACVGMTTKGALRCWGANDSGQLGDASKTNRTSGITIWLNGVTHPVIGTAKSARIIVAGDISCSGDKYATVEQGAFGAQCGAGETAALVQRRSENASTIPDAVLALGDLQYESGDYDSFLTLYDQSWGLFKNQTYPVRGNHEYITPGANGYTQYFEEMSQSYYSADLGPWKLLVVDSWCLGQLYFGCSAQSHQTTWLTEQLALAKASEKCVTVAMHHPPFSSGHFATSTSLDLWAAIVAGGADVVVTGHDHIYERFSPLDAVGNPSATGTRLFINGLGGAPTTGLKTPVSGSEFRYKTTHAMLELEFTQSAYSWKLISTLDDSTVDVGTSSCTP